MTDLARRLRDALDEVEFSEEVLLRRATAALDAPRPRDRFGLPAVGAAGIAIALVVALGAVALNRPAPSGPSLPTATSIDNLVDYRLVSADVGWVYLQGSDHRDVVARTADGGRSWHQVLSMPHRFPLAMQAVDVKTAALMGQEDLQGNGLVWKTDDAGVHWTRHVIASPAPGFILGASGYFVGPRTGWMVFAVANCGAGMACAGQGVIRRLVYRTGDGGETWDHVGEFPGLGSPNLSVQFIDSNTGMASGDSFVATTRDGGRSWKYARFGLAAPGCPPGTSAPICHFGDRLTAALLSRTDGVVIVTRYYVPPDDCSMLDGRCPPDYFVLSRVAYTSSDAGLSWTPGHSLPATFGCVTFFSLARGFMAGPTAVESTDDGGATWSLAGSIPIPAGWYPAKAGFSDPEHGWVMITNSAAEVVGARQTGDLFGMLTTSDGGQTWRQVDLPKA